MSKLEEWFNYNAILIATQIQEKEKSFVFRGLWVKPFLLEEAVYLPLLAKGLQKFIKETPVKYISVLQGEEANYIVFLDANLNKFHVTWLGGGH